ncbi:MAG: hypothetical protein HWN67_22720 [Candidatus Helarchaeota archaeon]|nr:hypothetical protein [Candidatus Helarchaeota archaeon]
MIGHEFTGLHPENFIDEINELAEDILGDRKIVKIVMGIELFDDENIDIIIDSEEITLDYGKDVEISGDIKMDDNLKILEIIQNNYDRLKVRDDCRIVSIITIKHSKI